jgi:hypothetical protein
VAAPAGAPLGIEVARDGTVSIEGSRLADASELTSRTRMSLQTRPDLRVVIAADKETPFDRVVRVADFVKQGGATHISFAVAKSPAPAARTTTPTGASGGEPAPPTVPTPSVFPGEAWNCPSPGHPAHSDPSKQEHAEVFVRIYVDANGNPEKVDVLEDPGRGFGEAARECAMRRSYRPAIDAKGSAVPGVLKLHIRFGT